MYAYLRVPRAPVRQDVCIFTCPARPWEAGCMHIGGQLSSETSNLSLGLQAHVDPGVSKRAHANFNGFHKAQNGAATFVMGDVNLDLKNMAECSEVCL